MMKITYKSETFTVPQHCQCTNVLNEIGIGPTLFLLGLRLLARLPLPLPLRVGIRGARLDLDLRRIPLFLLLVDLRLLAFDRGLRLEILIKLNRENLTLVTFF